MSAAVPAVERATMTFRDALRLALREEMLRDERVFVMGEEVGVFEGAYKVTAGLLEEFGEDRVRDTPISEEGFLGAGVGAAMIGERPVVEIMTINFMLVAIDQLVNHAAKIGAMFGGEVRCPLVIRTPGGAGNQLTAQHSQSLEVWFASVPGLKVVAPATPADAKGLLKAAIRDDDPVLVVENLSIYKERGEVPLDPEFLTPIGLANVAREGTDVTLVAHSFSTVRALHVAERLAGAARHQRRGRRPALAAPARHRDRRRVGFQDEPRGVRRGGLADLRRQRRARGPHPARLLRRSRCAGRARRHRGGAAALREGARDRRAAQRGADRGGRARDARASRMTDVIMPRLSDSMEEGTILKWLKSSGEEVKLGEPIAEIETDKATMTYEADAAGFLQQVAAEGDTLAIGAVIARLLASADEASAAAPAASAPAAAEPAPPAAPQGAPEPDAEPAAAAAPEPDAEPRPRQRPSRTPSPRPRWRPLPSRSLRRRPHRPPRRLPSRRPAPPLPADASRHRRWLAASPPSLASSSRRSPAAALRAAS